jgi:hypothetical protein
MPEQEAVLAITSGVGDMQAVLNAAWDHLLPGMQGAALPATGGAGSLTQQLAALAVRPPDGNSTSPTAARVSGRTYRLDANAEKLQTVTPTFNGDRCSVVLRGEGGEHSLASGAAGWIKGTAPLAGNPLLAGRPSARVAARGAWVSDDSYAMKLCFYETPYVETVTWKFDGDQLTVTRKMNVSFGPTERPALVGRAAS